MPDTEAYFTINQAADILGLKRWKLRRAAKAGVVPSYRFFNARCLVRLSEVVATIENSRTGGDPHVA